MWKKIRIAVLLFILFLVAADTYLTKYRAISWDDTLWVGVYPINIDNDPKIAKYISGLSNRNFEHVEQFFEREASELALPIKHPFKMMLAHPVDELPPAPPPRGSNVLSIAWWSLQLRYWSYSHDHADFSPHIKIFVIYHNYEKAEKLAHSLGLEKGMIGVVHGYAHRELEGKNNLVIAHEMLHTLGATDKYDLESGEPIHPQGYAEPDKSPLYPQTYAELMGGRLPVSQSRSAMPRNLRLVKVGTLTAKEINWSQN